MKLPTVHLNGSSGHELLRQNIEARKALRRALEALEEASPNARDYYVQDENAHRQAVQEHLARVQRLRDVSTELDVIIDHLDQQTTKRRHY